MVSWEHLPLLVIVIEGNVMEIIFVVGFIAFLNLISFVTALPHRLLIFYHTGRIRIHWVDGTALKCESRKPKYTNKCKIIECDLSTEFLVKYRLKAKQTIIWLW